MLFIFYRHTLCAWSILPIHFFSQKWSFSKMAANKACGLVKLTVEWILFKFYRVVLLVFLMIWLTFGKNSLKTRWLTRDILTFSTPPPATAGRCVYCTPRECYTPPLPPATGRRMCLSIQAACMTLYVTLLQPDMISMSNQENRFIYRGWQILIVSGRPDDFPGYWTTEHRDKNRQLLVAQHGKMLAQGIRACDLASPDICRSWYCLPTNQSVISMPFAMSTNHAEPAASFDHRTCHDCWSADAVHAYFLWLSDDGLTAFLTDKFNYLHSHW